MHTHTTLAPHTHTHTHTKVLSLCGESPAQHLFFLSLPPSLLSLLPSHAVLWYLLSHHLISSAYISFRLPCALQSFYQFIIYLPHISLSPPLFPHPSPLSYLFSPVFFSSLLLSVFIILSLSHPHAPSVPLCLPLSFSLFPLFCNIQSPKTYTL